jgi:hypothetical protein
MCVGEFAFREKDLMGISVERAGDGTGEWNIGVHQHHQHVLGMSSITWTRVDEVVLMDHTRLQAYEVLVTLDFSLCSSSEQPLSDHFPSLLPSTSYRAHMLEILIRKQRILRSTPLAQIFNHNQLKPTPRALVNARIAQLQEMCWAN